MNCSDLDRSIQNIDHAVINETVVFIIFTIGTSIFSLIMLVYGEFVVKTTSIVIAGFATTVITFVFSAIIQSIPCIFRIVLACVAGFGAICATACLFCIGPILIGGAAFGAGAHYIYTALPLHDVSSPFNLMGESAYYYIVMCIAILIGCIVACFKKKMFMQACSSIIGGAGTAIVVDVIFLRLGSSLSSFTFPIVIFATATFGFLIQLFLTIRRRRRKKLIHFQHREDNRREVRYYH